MSSVLEIQRHLELVSINANGADQEHSAADPAVEQLRTTPLFSLKAHKGVKDVSTNGLKGEDILPHYGLIGIRLATYGKDVGSDEDGEKSIEQDAEPEEQLVYTNTNAPWSTFICGSQGSGKSHTMSCMLENSLVAPSKTGRVSTPLAGLVLHYDKFTGIETGQICEAAYLCTSGIPVRVLVSPSNVARMKKLYENLPGLPENTKPPKVVPLKFMENHLNIGMMKALMATGGDGHTPLYMEVVTKILRDMAEDSDGPFKFNEFKSRLEMEKWAKGQSGPLNMRLRLLESFLDVERFGFRTRKKRENVGWNFEKGSLTIIDLSCPFVGADDACALFNICMSIFLEGRDQGGRIVVVDEAHKFLGSTSREASVLTETLLSVIRQQRHLATRVVIATQEPTLSPNFLDLCNITVVHRFTSPAWFKVLKGHLAGAVVGVSESPDKADSIFARIVLLNTGEALVFCPSAVLDVEQADSGEEDFNEEYPNEEYPNEEYPNEEYPTEEDSDEEDCSDEDEDEDEGETLVSEDMSADRSSSPTATSMRFKELGPRYIKLKVRKRVTTDGGKSILAQEAK